VFDGEAKDTKSPAGITPEFKVEAARLCKVGDRSNRQVAEEARRDPDGPAPAAIDGHSPKPLWDTRFVGSLCGSAASPQLHV
jgi:hypothetical protein